MHFCKSDYFCKACNSGHKPDPRKFLFDFVHLKQDAITNLLTFRNTTFTCFCIDGRVVLLIQREACIGFTLKPQDNRLVHQDLFDRISI